MPLHSPAPAERLGLVLNSKAAARDAPPAGPFSPEGFAHAASVIAAFPQYAPTPLRSLKGLAKACGVGEILYKDEAERFGLQSFKPLGAPYAAAELLLAHLKRSRPDATLAEVVKGQHSDGLGAVTLISATDGNHGRALAWAAKEFGARAKIFAHDGMSAGRREAITELGAELVICPGGYDDSVRAAFEEGERTGNPVVQDTAAGSYRDVPAAITYGYGTIAHEVFGEIDEPPTHAIVQAGVGGVASALCAQFWHGWGAARPRFVVLEPTRAACVAASLAAGRQVVVEGDTHTAMAGLACGTVSDIAWEVLETGADAALIAPDSLAFEGVRALARPAGDDPSIVAGECAGGAVGALLALAHRPDLRAALDITSASRVFVLGTEGATDGAIYEKILAGRESELA